MWDERERRGVWGGGEGRGSVTGGRVWDGRARRGVWGEGEEGSVGGRGGEGENNTALQLHVHCNAPASHTLAQNILHTLPLTGRFYFADRPRGRGPI